MSLSVKPRTKQPPAVADQPKVRKSSRAGSDTRKKLLDSAECLFAEKGYDGTSLRDIAEAAGQHLALSTYHFGTKERLFEEVIKRRASTMESMRLAGLAEVDVASMVPSDAVRALIEAYSMPMIKARYGSSKQWQAHVKLMSQLLTIKQWVPVIRKYYDNCGQAYIEKFHEALPDAEHDSLLNSFSFMISTMLYVCSYPNRFGKMKTSHLSSKKEVAVVTENFVKFVHAGFLAL